jgi:hypothetical protein
MALARFDGPNSDTQPIHLAGSSSRLARQHVCAFYSDPDELDRLLLPFVKEGLERGEKVLQVVPPGHEDEHRKRLRGGGIDVVHAEDTGIFELHDWEELYFREGRFDQYRMLGMWQRVLEGAASMGFPRTRVFAMMEWALQNRPGVCDLVEYETRFNFTRRQHDAVICAYDLRRFSNEILVGVLRAHPMILINGILQDNPLFVPSDQLLRELGERKARGPAGPTPT